MHYFPDFFEFLFDFKLATAPPLTWIDGEILALGGVSFALLSLFGYVVHTQIDRKESEVPDMSDQMGEEAIVSQHTEIVSAPVQETVPLNGPEVSDSPEEEKVGDLYFTSFYLPIQGKTLEAVRQFFDSLPPGSGTWELLLHSESGKKEIVARKSGTILVFPGERTEATEIYPGVLSWPLVWETSSLGELRQVPDSERDFSISDLSMSLDRLTENLVTGSESQDSETGWGSYSHFLQHLEKENAKGEEPKILLYMEFHKNGNLLPEFKSLGRWWKERFGEFSPLSRVRNNRLSTILSPEDWIRFQDSLSGLMEFLGPDRISLNVGASVRVKRQDQDWEQRAKRALHSSKEEGPNRLVCL